MRVFFYLGGEEMDSDSCSLYWLEMIILQNNKNKEMTDIHFHSCYGGNDGFRC